MAGSAKWVLTIPVSTLLGEPVAWQGPIVMNTREELRIAFDDYQRGTFMK